MSFDWLEYFNLAQELVGQSSTSSEEAKMRSAISRAYYAAFCLARNHLLYKDGVQIPKKNVHGRVRLEFQNSSDKARKQVGVDLNRLRINRNDADYEDDVTGLSSVTTTALSRSQSIISALNKL